MMKNEILKIISNDTEPVYALSGYLQHLQDNIKSEFWADIKELAFNGNEAQKFVLLSFISLEKHELQAELIDIIVSEISPTSTSTLLLPLLRMIQNLHRVDLVLFCQKAMEAALKRNDIKTVEMAFRTILILDWEKILPQLSNRIQTNNVKQIIDTMAYFKRTHSLSDWEKLLRALKESDRKRVEELEGVIDIRCQRRRVE